MPKKINTGNFRLNIRFNLRQPKASNLTAINCVVRYNNERIVFSKVETVEPSQWNELAQKAKQTVRNPRAGKINSRLAEAQRIITDLFTDYTAAQKHYPPVGEFQEECKIVLFPQKAKKQSKDKIMTDLIAFTEKFIEDAEAGRWKNSNDEPIAENTIKIYRTMKRNLAMFRDQHGYDLSFQNMGLEFFADYKDFMTNELSYSKNTLGKHIRTLKAVINEARAKGCTKAVFSGKRFNAPSEDTTAIYLNEEELQVLYDLDLSKKPTLEAVRDLFLVGCWTGLRFSDFTTIEAADVAENFIRKKTKKTKEPVIIPILPVTAKIIEKYKGITPNSLPPAMVNAVTNRYLKEIGRMAEFDQIEAIKYTKAGKEITLRLPKYKLISTHTARRSFATNLFERKEQYGISVADIMAITGHRTESAFYTYIRRKKEDSARKILQVFNRQNLQVTG